MTKNTPDPKTTYLNTIRDLVTKLHARNGLSLCPCHGEPDTEDVRKLSVLNRDIEKTCSEMRRIESEGGNAFGVGALLGRDVADCICAALSVMVASVASGAVVFHDVAGDTGVTS